MPKASDESRFIHAQTGPLCSFRPHAGDLSFSHYQQMLEKALAKTYDLVPVSAATEGLTAKKVILRHDVDLLPERALQMAKIEHEVGAKATYYIRIAANEYNALSPTCLQIFGSIKAMGHELGLHCECLDVARALGQDPLEILHQHVQVFESVFGPSSTLASHNDTTPHNNLRFLETKTARDFLKQRGIVEAYSSELGLFGSNLYMTDSHPWYWRAFENGAETDDRSCLCERLQNDPPTERICLLTHPHLWYPQHFQIRL